MRLEAQQFLRSHTGHEEARLIIVSPHPDDEVIGAGTRLKWWRNTLVVQVTDGSPKDLEDASANGFRSRGEYSRARHLELEAALSLVGDFQTLELDVPDQEASWHLRSLTTSLVELFRRWRPDIVLTVPYEGGHPDHDATAFAVHTALDLLPDFDRPQLWEMLAYHRRGSGCEYESFLNECGIEIAFSLTPEECRLKRQMFDCFRTQSSVLRWFPIGLEKFRIAPRYDFTAAPHDGPLYYEGFPWGMTGQQWRELARGALSDLIFAPTRALAPIA